jgi:hypothetical protein
MGRKSGSMEKSLLAGEKTIQTKLQSVTHRIKGNSRGLSWLGRRLPFRLLSCRFKKA